MPAGAVRHRFVEANGIRQERPAEEVVGFLRTL
jgi:hypothetical protein